MSIWCEKHSILLSKFTFHCLLMNEQLLMHTLIVCTSPSINWLFISFAYFSIKILVHHSWIWMDYIKSSSHLLENVQPVWKSFVASTVISLCICSLLSLRQLILSHPSRLGSLMHLIFWSMVMSLFSELQSSNYPDLILSHLINYLSICIMSYETLEAKNVSHTSQA